MGKYSALGRYLSQQKGRRCGISFGEIEKVLGFGLPESAKTYRAWWAADYRHVQALDGWLGIGWSVEGVDFEGGFVEFARSGEAVAQAERMPDAGTSTPAHGFEVSCGKVMSKRYGVDLGPGQVLGVGKLFDFVSKDGQVVGDAKYYTLVRGVSPPPAKFSVIAEHVWLLEKVKAKHKFLAFGNDRRVPEKWLEKYGNLVKGVAFYYVDDSGAVTVLRDGD